MSLNGLDDKAVAEAHQHALTDPGGWFFLKYSNRDTVELLSRGNGGVGEAKAAVEQYHEKSPLYGMLQYRRKRVLLKYVPEGTSRLLQVRLTVQFQSILDAFPHDTIFSFTAATELVESALGLCTMLLPTNAGSLKSSDSSLRQRRLNEISEDAEENNMPTRAEEPQAARPAQIDQIRMPEVDDLSTLPASAVRAKALLAKRKAENLSLSQSNITLPFELPGVVATPVETPPPVSVYREPLVSLSQIKLDEEIASVRNGNLQTPEPQPSKSQPLPYHHSRHLSENESASISQWNEQVAAYTLPPPKPKKKLAPRPHIETHSRPNTANTYEENNPTRPVAILPTSVRVSNRVNPNNVTRPGSQQSSRSVPARFNATPSLPPPLPDFNPLYPQYNRPESRRAGSITSSAVTDVTNVSPEKLRLMRALQNRKRTQFLSPRATSAQSNLTTLHDDFPMGVRSQEKPIPINPLPSPIREETVQNSRDVKNTQDSSTASPTSIATISETLSTRPSSFAEDRNSQSSQKTASRDTDSSSTPRANGPEVRAGSKEGKNRHNSMTNGPRREQYENSNSSVTTKAENFQARDSVRPTANTVQSKQSSSHTPDKATLAWLASSNQLDPLKSSKHPTVSTPDDNGHKSNLGVDTLTIPVTPVTESSSVMSEDDALVEELRAATVQEATSVAVRRPPLTPTMRTYSHDRSRATTLSGSNLTPKSSRSIKAIQIHSPAQSLGSMSTALPQLPGPTETESLAGLVNKKPVLSHGISKRIKALEDSSRKETTSSPAVQDSTVNRSTFTNLMKRNSLIAHFQGPEALSDRRLSRETSYPTPSATDKFTAARARTQRQGSVNDSSQIQINGATGAPTGRNYYDHAQPSPSSTVRGAHGRQPSTHAPSFVALGSAGPPSLASEKKRFSFVSYRSGTTTRTNGRWKHPESMTSKVSLNTKESWSVRGPTSEASSVHEDKKGSRATRLMKRVSGFGTRFGGKGQPSSTEHEEHRPDAIVEQHEPVARTESIAESTMQTVDIGDVNVQFPEALLWKRRFLRVDDQGYLLFSTPTDGQSARPAHRKFHLGDIQEPCLPDAEREEMAWSVLLDLRDGNCIQCACESKQAQSQVLKMLLDAHSAYHSLYPDALD